MKEACEDCNAWGHQVFANRFALQDKQHCYRESMSCAGAEKSLLDADFSHGWTPNTSMT